jgi:hypothetical protein
LAKACKVDLVFIASRNFDIKIGVSLVRFIKTSAPHTWNTADKQMLLNNLDYKGMEYKDYKIEWNTIFTLRGLRKGKTPPKHSINKLIKMNCLQSNTFEKNNVSEAMAQAASTALGKGISVRVNEVADGDVSSQFYLLIKYRKVQKPQQFTYSQVIHSNAGRATASVETPVVTDDSFDIPSNSGFGVDGQDGSPFTDNSDDQTKCSFYLHGKIGYQFGFKRDCESVPSIVSSDPSHADYKKAQCLMIDPTYTSDDTYGFYTESPNHVQLAASTAGTGP